MWLSDISAHNLPKLNQIKTSKIFLSKGVLSYHRNLNLTEIHRRLTIEPLACFLGRQIDEAWHIIAIHALRRLYS